MNISIDYNAHGHYESELFYGIRIAVVKSERDCFYPFIYKNLLNTNSTYVNAINLLSETYLKENNIEYILNDKKDILPIGLIEFSLEYGDKELKLSCNKTEELYKVEQVKNNIVEAIKIKHKTYLLSEKCRNRITENIEI